MSNSGFFQRLIVVAGFDDHLGNVRLDKQLAQLDEQQANQPAEMVDMKVVLQYARYLVEHLADILLHLRNPLRKAAFFGAIFNAVPTYEDLVGGTQKNGPIPGVNELFCVTELMVPNLVSHRFTAHVSRLLHPL